MFCRLASPRLDEHLYEHVYEHLYEHMTSCEALGATSLLRCVPERDVREGTHEGVRKRVRKGVRKYVDT